MSQLKDRISLEEFAREVIELSKRLPADMTIERYGSLLFGVAAQVNKDDGRELSELALDWITSVADVYEKPAEKVCDQILDGFVRQASSKHAEIKRVRRHLRLGLDSPRTGAKPRGRPRRQRRKKKR